MTDLPEDYETALRHRHGLVWAHAQCRLRAPQRLVLMAIAMEVDADGRSRPPISVVASRSGCSERTVQRYLAWLDAEGAIRRTRDGVDLVGFNVFHHLLTDGLACPSCGSPVSSYRLPE